MSRRLDRAADRNVYFEFEGSHRKTLLPLLWSKPLLAAKKVQVALRKNGWVNEYAFREEGERALYSEPISIEGSHLPPILQ
jgi:hypothetical protein